jgi:hypothetical protein
MEEIEYYQIEFSDDCRVPFSPCWCERRPNHPHCQDQVVNANIESDFFLAFILAGILILIRKKF